MRAVAQRTTGKRVQHTTTMWWEVPHCRRCVDHSIRFARASRVLPGALLCSGVAWALLAIGGVNVWPALLAAAAVLGSGIFLYRHMITSAAERLLPDCASRTSAVRYLAWHGTFHTLVFTNRDYLDEFIASNERKKMSDIREI